METKQTAVDWLIEELGEYFPYEIGGIHLMVAKAKAMEKEQIEKAFHHSIVAMVAGKFLSPEQYYNETYGKHT